VGKEGRESLKVGERERVAFEVELKEKEQERKGEYRSVQN